MAQPNHYATLGVTASATAEELRRAYRILARRYHPDVNPGKGNEDRFKAIAEAYEVLSDSAKRKAYDLEYERTSHFRLDPRIRAYTRQHRQHFQTRAQQSESTRRAAAQPAQESPQTRPARPAFSPVSHLVRQATKKWNDIKSSVPKFPSLNLKFPARKPSPKESKLLRVSVIEISITMQDAISGLKKAVEISEPQGTRKVSVQIPPGVKNGSVVRLRSKGDEAEELVLIVRVPNHPFLSIQNRGVVVEVPLSVGEAINGANITVPTLDEQMVVRVVPGTQSGSEIRLKDKGILFRDGSRGDLFLRFIVKVPEAADAVGLSDRARELELYYGSSVRQNFPKNLMES